MVKLADKLYNITDLERATPQGWSDERKMQYFLWSAKVVLGLRGSNQIIEDKIDEVLTRNGIEKPKEVRLDESEINE